MTAIDNGALTAILVRQARGLLDPAGPTDPEYLRGIVELIVRATGRRHSDGDDEIAAMLDVNGDADDLTAEPDPLPQQDLRALLDYGWSSEERDYIDNPGDRHIFLVMRRLDDWLHDSATS
jgi:hypothetical protein